MIYHLLMPLGGPFNVFRYITFRSACAMVTALTICYLLYPAFIAWLHKRKMEQVIRRDGPEAHVETKLGTPTMGGAVFHFGIAVSTLLWARIDEPRVWMVLGVLLGYAGIGLYDDWKKIHEQKADGLSGRWKIAGQTIIGGGLLAWAYGSGIIDSLIHVPFWKHALLDPSNWVEGLPWLGWLVVLWGAFVLVGASNAVNLTDGLDGLAIGSTITSAGTFAVIAYVAGHVEFSAYLNIPHVDGAGELTIVAMAMVGSGLGFLWYNCFPAQIFMGDTGSLGLGGALGMIALLTKHELLLVLVGGIFVLEAVSVMIQVFSYKRFGKRVFLMAPIHHHYEKQGWSEPKIIVRFWIISVLLALVALATLKLR